MIPLQWHGEGGSLSKCRLGGGGGFQRKINIEGWEMYEYSTANNLKLNVRGRGSSEINCRGEGAR